MKTREAGRLVFLLSLAALAAACEPPSLADPTGGGAAAAPEADGPLILAAASEADGPFVTIVPDGPRPGPVFVRPGHGPPHLANESEPDFTCEDIGDCGDKCAGRRVSVCCCRKLDDGGDDKFQCWEGECSGGGGGGGEEVGGDDGWWDDIWEIISCGGDRGRLASEYGRIGWLLCWAFWLHGPEWIVPDGDIEYGEVHGRWGLMFWSMQNLVRKMENHFGIKALVTSGYRCPIGNSGTPDAKPKSQHVWGSAYDFKVPGWANDRKQEIVDWVIRLGGGKWAEHYPDNPSKPHIHMQLFPKNPFFDQETDQ